MKASPTRTFDPGFDGLRNKIRSSCRDAQYAIFSGTYSVSVNMFSHF